MSRTIVSTKVRHMADQMARANIGVGNIPLKRMQPRDRVAYRNERALAIRYLTKGRTYYTAACFPAY